MSDCGTGLVAAGLGMAGRVDVVALVRAWLLAKVAPAESPDMPGWFVGANGLDNVNDRSIAARQFTHNLDN
jgi:hypothetical protein